MNVEAVNDGLDDLLTKTVRANLTLSKPAEILDAGCGRMWTWDLANVPYRLTGVDSDEVALRLRVENVGDLDEWIVGDLRTVNMPPDRYDIVHCAYVLEHVEGAELVLDRLLDTLRPGGLMVLRVPDRDS